MVTDNISQADDTTAFLRAARSGNLEKVIEFLDTDLDINTANSNGLNALHLASKDGHVEIVTELLKRGAKVDAATKKGNTALHIASLAGQSEIVNILIQYGAAVNIQSQNGFTPLYMAAQENHDQVVKLLLSNGANQSLATEDGFTPLAVAMQQGHDKVVSVLLENDSKGKVRLPALHIAAKKDDCKAADLLLQNDHKPDVTSKSGFTPLHIAAHYGNEEIARLLIKRGADVNYLAKHNISPLHVAAKWGKNNMVKILLENSAQIDAKTRDGLTPLHCAARSGHEQVVTTLLENSAPISARTKNGLAPLHMASQGDHVDAARVLLYHRAPVDEVTIDYLTSLHVAAHCGHVRVAKLLLDRKADPNARALNGFTPLHIACKKNRIKVVELLLKHGASIESTTESGLTPLHVASFMGCMNIVIFLLQHEANPDVPTVRGETPLHLAARANQTDIIRILLRNGAKVDARAREQQTPLHIASRLGNIDIVMLLLQHGAAVDTTTKDMYTALHIAAKEGQEEVAAILVDNNASLKAATKNGFTPLHIAAKYGNMNVAKILLQKDSKLDAQGKNDISPLHLACHYDHPNVANLLLERGASAHLASQNGHTPLHIAARKNQMDIASTLLENGANANAESKAGFTPLHLSAQKGHYDMTNLLIEHGADPNHKAKNGLTALHLCAQEDFIRVASILVKNSADVESETETGYRPIHVAAHFGNLSMIRFLLKHNAQIDVRTKQNYTPLHQAAQQGHAHIVTALLEGNASHKARTNDGLTALNIAQKLGYISVMEVLKGLSYDTLTPDNKNWEDKYKVIAPESLQETSFMSDSDDEGGSDALISEQPYRYLTADLMKSLRDDSLPIDVTRDDPIHRQVTKEEKQEFVQSNNYCLAENFDSNDTLNLGRLHFRSFLVSFLVDARGGAMKGCRHSGVRIIVPPRRAAMPIRVTCRLVKPSKVPNPPPLMEGEALATRIIEMGPVGATFLGPVLIDIPHFASIRGKEREIVILRSENGETWKEHDNMVDNDDTLLNTPYDPQMSASHSGRITRIITTDFPQYFAIVTRIKQEVHVIGAEGGILISSVASHVQAVFPPGALTKKIKVGLQAHVIPTELTAKLLGNCVAVSPVITIEPRRRKFHKPITLTIPVPQAANKGMINQYGGETPTLRLLCSIAGGTSEAQWEDVTGSTPLTFMNDRVSFTTTVSARFWLMDCRNISEVPKMATELYKESLFVPYITNFVIYSKRMDLLEATLRILCMTDGKEGLHTLERQEEFLEIVKSRDVEALDGKDLYIEFSGNLVPVTKSGVQLKFTFKAFRQNRLSFHVKVKDPLLDPVARMLFMREPKVAKGEPPQQPICVLNIVLPEMVVKAELRDKVKDYEDSNIIDQKMDTYASRYKLEQKEKCDEPKETSPSDNKFITDTLQKEQTDAATIHHESLAQKAACPLESVDASYSRNVVDSQDGAIERQEGAATGTETETETETGTVTGTSTTTTATTTLTTVAAEKQTYSEKRKFWEDISKKRESYQRSESEVSRTSQLTINESDSDYLQNVASEGEDESEVTGDVLEDTEREATEQVCEMPEDQNVPDISECSVAEKAHYFEEQIQKEMAAKQQQPDAAKEKDKSGRSSKVFEEQRSIDGDERADAEADARDEKHVTELTQVEKVVTVVTSRRDEEEGKEEERTESTEVEKTVVEEPIQVSKLISKLEQQVEVIKVEKVPVDEKRVTEVTKTEKIIEMPIKEKKVVEDVLEKERVEVSKIIKIEETTVKRETEQKEAEKEAKPEEEPEAVQAGMEDESQEEVEKGLQEKTEKPEDQEHVEKGVGDQLEKIVDEATEKAEARLVEEERKESEGTYTTQRTEIIETVLIHEAKEVRRDSQEEKEQDESKPPEEVKETVSVSKDVERVEIVKVEPTLHEQVTIVEQKPSVTVVKEEVTTVLKPVEKVVREEVVTEVKPFEKVVKEEVITEDEPLERVVTKEIITEVKPMEITVKEEVAMEVKPGEKVDKKEVIKEVIEPEKLVKEEVITEVKPVEKVVTEEIITIVKPVETVTKEEVITQVMPPQKLVREEVIAEVKPIEKVVTEEIITEVKPAQKVTREEIIMEVKPAEKVPREEIITEVKPAEKVTREEIITEVKQPERLVREEVKTEVKPSEKSVKEAVTAELVQQLAQSKEPEPMREVRSEHRQEARFLEREDSFERRRTGGRRVIKEETTIIYKVQEDGSLVQEQVLKSVEIQGPQGEPVIQVPEVSLDTHLFDTVLPDTVYEAVKERQTPPIVEGKIEPTPLTDIRATVEQFLQGDRRIPGEDLQELEQKQAATQEAVDAECQMDEAAVKESIGKEVKQIKKEFESRIPVSTAKHDKDRKEAKSKISPDAKPAQMPEKSPLSPDRPSGSEKTMGKRDFESRIPKRIVDTTVTTITKQVPEKDARKESSATRRETETYTVTEKSSAEVTSKQYQEHSSTTKKSETFVKSFADPQEAFKAFEEMAAAKDKPEYSTVKVDHKESRKVEKKEVVSSEITTGADKLITHEEKQQVEKKKSSESKTITEAPSETTEEKKSKTEELDKVAVQKMSMNLSDGKQVIDASASESLAEVKKERLFKTVEDPEGTSIRDAGSSSVRESDVGVAVKFEKDSKAPDDAEKLKEKGEDLGKLEKFVKEESHKESRDSFDVQEFVPSEKTDKLRREEVSKDLEQVPTETSKRLQTLEERQRQVAKENEARGIAEILVQSIEQEIEKRSLDRAKPEKLGSEYLERIAQDGTLSEHERLADDLTRQFESIMKKSATEERSTTKIRSSVHEDAFEKGSTRDSISVSEDLTRDEESSAPDKDESFPLSSAQIVKLEDRDITISPSSISDQIELEETMDVDTEVLDDVSRRTSTRSNMQHDVDLDAEQFHKDKMVSEISGARVLEILEPGADGQSRQDSMDVSSLEMDEQRFSLEDVRDSSSLHKSAAVDSLDKIYQNRDITVSPSTVSEDTTNADSSFIQEHPSAPAATEIVADTVADAAADLPQDRELEAKRVDSFEIESPPLVSPRSKVQELEIKPVTWMIGDEKIEISETLQPSQVFNQELEEYEQKQKLTEESADLEQEAGTKSSEDTSVTETSVKRTVEETDEGTVTTIITTTTTKFTVVPVSESDFESELIENKLDVTCQELVDTLQREYEAKTPTDEYSVSMRNALTKPRDLQLESGDESEVQKEEEEKVEAEEITEEVAEKAAEVIKDSEPSEATVDKSVEDSHPETVEKKEEIEPKTAPEQREEVAAERTDEVTESEPIKTDESVVEVEQIETMPSEKDDEKMKIAEATESVIKKESEETVEKKEVPAHVTHVAKERTEPYLMKVKSSVEEYKMHVEKTGEKHEKRSASSMPSDTCAFKIKKDEPPSSVDLSARYAITVLDQVVKKEIAEVKESLEAAKQDLIEELSEQSETVFQIKDSPSEFQFKLQPESIPNDLPFLYRPPSLERIATIGSSEAEAVTTERIEHEESRQAAQEVKEAEQTVEVVAEAEQPPTPIIVEEEQPDSYEEDKEKSEKESSEQDQEITVVQEEESEEFEDAQRYSPLALSRSSPDADVKDESSSSALLPPPQPVPRRRQKPARASKKVTSESEADIGSSSGESSNYQSCDYEIGSGSRPSSSDVEALQSATGTVPSGTASEYETALMSIEHSTGSRPTSQDYHTAVSTLSSRESIKSLNSLSSGHLGSIDSTSELSETLVPSEPEMDKDEIEESLESALDDTDKDRDDDDDDDDDDDEDEDEGDADAQGIEQTDSSSSEIPVDEPIDKIDSSIPCRMKRSSEMIFQQVLEDTDAERRDAVGAEGVDRDVKGIDSSTSAFVVGPGPLQSVDIMTSRVTEDGVQSVCTQVISTQVTPTTVSTTEVIVTEPKMETVATTETVPIEAPLSEVPDAEPEKESMESEPTESRSTSAAVAAAAADESPETTVQTSGQHSMMQQQASMSTSSASGISIDTVVDRDKSERHSPDSDSFELVDKPDIIDDFVVIEEVGREAEEYDSEGKSIRISSMPQVSDKNFDRDLENLIADAKDETGAAASASQVSRNNDVFDFESEESPPQASNDDQYSQQSYSDDEQFDAASSGSGGGSSGGKKWIEMQFQADTRLYDIEYDRGPLEDIKEEEITDFEAGSSRFGSLGSHKESIGSVGSMRGSFGSTPDYDVLAGRKFFGKPTEHDNVSLSSLQEFEHLESAVAAENSRRLQQCGSQDSINNGSLPRRYMASRSGHGDDVSLSSLKDFEGLEKACREAHLIELRAREEEDLLEHESPENKYRLENLPRGTVTVVSSASSATLSASITMSGVSGRTETTRIESTSAAGSINISTSGSDDYEKRIKEIDEIIRIAQSNVERMDRQDDTTEDISQITDIERIITSSGAVSHGVTQYVQQQQQLMDTDVPLTEDPLEHRQAEEEEVEEDEIEAPRKEANIMETSTDSLELEENIEKRHPLCRSSDSLEMKTTLDFPSLSSDSLNNVRDPREGHADAMEQFSSTRRISSDSLEMALMPEQQDTSDERLCAEGNGAQQERSSQQPQRQRQDSQPQEESSSDTSVAKSEAGKVTSSPSSGT